MRAASRWLLVVSSGILASCFFRLYPPVAFVEHTAPIYLPPRPENCKLLETDNAPPSGPYEIFAQITAYGNSPEVQEKMRSLIEGHACELGADGVIFLPLQEVDHLSSFNTYPDWLVGKEPGMGDRTQVQVDRRYSLRQRGIAFAFKRAANPTGN
jgi:hypothetical protein